MRQEDLQKNPYYPDNPDTLAMPRIDVRSLSQEAYDHIKRLILSGVFKDGEKIPEEKIANILNVSRTPIREALRQLEQYGLVYIKPRSYAKVVGITEGEAKQIAKVRHVLEKLAIETLFANPSLLRPDALVQLANQALERFDSGSMVEAYILDSAFHLELARQCGNTVLHNVLERLDAKNQLVRIRSNLSPELYRVQLAEHLDMVRLLTAGDADGMEDLLENHMLLGSAATM